MAISESVFSTSFRTNWIIMIIFLGLDLSSKIWIRLNVPLYETTELLANKLDLTHVQNRGVSFSFLADISDNLPNIYTEDQMVGEIDFDTQEEEQIETNETIQPQVEEVSPLEKRKKHKRLLEDRTANSQKQIDDVNDKAKKLYSDLDGFINGLRDGAANAPDNPYLCKKFEGIRRLCVGFVRSMQSQLPRSPASLFVNVEENNNEQ